MIPKYRAWDKKKERMVRVLNLNLEARNIVGEYLTDKEVYTKTDSKGNTTKAYYLHQYIMGFDRVELMPSMGFNDESGEEVYLSDIVNLLDTLGIWEIKYCDESRCYYYTEVGGGERIRPIYIKCRVRGNKYEK